MHRARVAQGLNESFPEFGSTGGAFPFAKIYDKGEGPREVRSVPPRLFARSALPAERRVLG